MNNAAAAVPTTTEARESKLALMMQAAVAAAEGAQGVEARVRRQQQVCVLLMSWVLLMCVVWQVEMARQSYQTTASDVKFNSQVRI